MHDIKAIRDNPAAFDQGLGRRGLAPLSAALLTIDVERREHVQKLQDAQASRNAASKEIGEAMKTGDKARAEQLKAEMGSIKDFITSGEAVERDLNERLETALAVIPNIPLYDVPDGSDETGNVEVRRWGTPPEFNYEARQHFDIGEWLGQMDFETAAKISGARFVVLKGQLARLERALAQFMLEVQTGVNGYTEHYVPFMVNDAAMFGTAQLPKFKDDQFSTIRLEKPPEGLYQLALMNLNSSVDHAEALRPLIPAGMTMPEMALRFILCNPDVHTIIPGMRKLRNVEANMAASDGKMLPESLRLKLKDHRWTRASTEWSQ